MNYALPPVGGDVPGPQAPPDLPPDVPGLPPDLLVDVPFQLDVLPDGREAVVFGDVAGLADLNHKQGDNPYGFEGTCGLCSCQDILNQFGVEVTEADVVRHAVANGECYVSDDPAASGGTTEDGQAQILGDYGLPAHVEHGSSLEDLAMDIEQGRGVIIEANAGVLWNDAAYYENGQANHAVVVTGVARDPMTGAVEGFFINDSGTGESAKYVDAATMGVAWLDAGATSVVTDAVRPQTLSGSIR